ncbi:hypothetical protein QQF64_011732 [Cirrhinus molitorella]|uniref:Secreted protein n=1 Tax=Cirrhinus molitorella TaxID=172907 RepID=A0ABR3LTF6_9TELE
MSNYVAIIRLRACALSSAPRRAWTASASYFSSRARVCVCVCACEDSTGGFWFLTPLASRLGFASRKNFAASSKS